MKINPKLLYENNYDNTNKKGYMKFSNGIMICYGSWSGNISFPSSPSWGSLYTTGINPNLTFAKEFTQIYSCNVAGVRTSSNSAWLFDSTFDNTGISYVQFARPSSVGSMPYGIDYIAIGSWK